MMVIMLEGIMLKSRTTKREDAVSEVIGTILLFALVVIIFGVVTLIAVNAVYEEAAYSPKSVPQVSFIESASGHHIYHGGGDSLLKSEIRIFSDGTDITEKTLIDDKNWDVWETGDALYLTEWHLNNRITICWRSSSGKEIIIYDGLKQMV